MCGLGAGCPSPVLLWLSCSEGPPPGSIPHPSSPPCPPKPSRQSPAALKGVTGVIARVLPVFQVTLLCTSCRGYAGCFGGII